MNHFSKKFGASLVAHMVKNLPAVQETQVPSLGWEDPLEAEMTTHSGGLSPEHQEHSGVLACRIPQTEEPGRPQSMGLQRVKTRLSD